MKTKLILDVNKTQHAQLNFIVTGRVGDKSSNVVDVYIIDSGAPYPLTGISIFYECLKPDNTVVRDDNGVKMIDAAKGHFEYTFPAETFGSPGKAKQSFFSIEKDEIVRSTTQDFTLVTLSDATTGRIPSGPYISDLEKLFGDIATELKELGSLEINSGSKYPLKPQIRNGSVSEIDPQINDAVLDIKILGAKPNKWYKLDWLGNGTTVWGDPNYSIYITEFDKNNWGNTRVVFDRVNHPIVTKPNEDITTQFLQRDGEDVTVSITINYKKLKKVSYAMNSAASLGYSWIIDESCYLRTDKQKPERALNSLEVNRGDNYPFKLVTRDGVVSNPITDIKNAILDVKVINAKPGKWYKVDWIGNGYTGWGTPNYSMFIGEYDEKTFENPRTIFDRVSNSFPAPTQNIEYKLFTKTNEDVMVSVTVDYSQLKKDRYPMNGVGDGYSYIIDESCYFHKKSVAQTVTESLKKNEVSVLKSGSTIKAKFYYSDSKDMIIEWAPLKNNKFTHFSKWYFQDKGRAWNDFSGTQTMATATDWVSPYGLMAVNNTVSTASFTVGGAHGTEGGTGFPTGRNQSTKVLVDGVEVIDGVAVKGSEIAIIAEHYVFASNVINATMGAARDVLRELVTYTVTPNNVQISTELRALEDCKITRYAGLQGTKVGGYWNKFYAMMDKVAIYDTADIAEGATEPKGKVNTDRFIMFGGSDTVVCYMNRFGIGDKRYVSDSNPYVYWTGGEFGKLYMHNIKQEVPLKAGESLFYSGGYTLMETFKNTLRGYFIKEGNQKVYVLDFHGTNNVIVDIGEYNKKVKVVDKTAGITCDDYVTGVGLRVNSVGYNQLKFILE
ncbi:DUF2479 domain-containing protein [Bacillus mycoides]|uniref:BppU family phage baseplate upper protein n=1 Tax=Bacillus mycoides TaxID=1405 RepID=UPI001C0142DE|nr:BppU family phage baseplate upper protein [Bacillus mycoides]QWH10359.1 DUF2479 domain-containing protein [Bacillus mycoides]